MSHPLALSTTELLSPNNPSTIDKLRRSQAKSIQLAAATLAADAIWQAPYPARVIALYLIAGADAASGESLVFDLQKNGTTVLTGTYTLDDSIDTTELIDLSSLLDTAETALALGDVLDVARTYTAGGDPTPIGASTVIAVIEPTNPK